MLCSGNLIVMSTRLVICARFPLPISISMSIVRRSRCTCAQHIRHASENWSILHVVRDPVELNVQKKLDASECSSQSLYHQTDGNALNGITLRIECEEGNAISESYSNSSNWLTGLEEPVENWIECSLDQNSLHRNRSFRYLLMKSKCVLKYHASQDVFIFNTYLRRDSNFNSTEWTLARVCDVKNDFEIRNRPQLCIAIEVPECIRSR